VHFGFPYWTFYLLARCKNAEEIVTEKKLSANHDEKDHIVPAGFKNRSVAGRRTS